MQTPSSSSHLPGEDIPPWCQDVAVELLHLVDRTPALVEPVSPGHLERRRVRRMTRAVHNAFQYALYKDPVSPGGPPTGQLETEELKARFLDAFGRAAGFVEDDEALAPSRLAIVFAVFTEMHHRLRALEKDRP